MKVPCAVCREPSPRVSLQRVGHRLLCRRCFANMRRRDHADGPPLPALQPMELRSLQRFNLVLTYVVLSVKAAFFLLFFWWAANSPTGDAALRGVVLGDVLTWIVLSALEWHFRRLQVTAGAIFEAILLILFLNRGSLLAIPEAPESMVTTLGFFFLTVLFKTAAWGAQHALAVSGVKEGTA